MDKKVIPPASSSQEKARQYSTDRACIINNRRRSIYKQLSSDKKEALLLQRRRRYQQLKNKNLLGGSPTPLPTVHLQFTGQKGVAITDIPPHPETGDTSCVDTSAAVSGKAKDKTDYLSIFEVGSTSAAPVKQHNPIAITVTTKGSASLAHQQHDPKAITDKNNGLLVPIEVLTILYGGWSGDDESSDWGKVPSTIPVLIFSLVYHDLAPVLCAYLESDLKRIRASVFIAGLVPLLALLVWDAIAFGLSSQVDQIVDPVELLLRAIYLPLQHCLLQAFTSFQCHSFCL